MSKKRMKEYILMELKEHNYLVFEKQYEDDEPSYAILLEDDYNERMAEGDYLTDDDYFLTFDDIKAIHEEVMNPIDDPEFMLEHDYDDLDTVFVIPGIYYGCY